MIRSPNCKINLGLFVTEKCPDGFHNIETIFLPIPLYDELEIEVTDAFSFQQEGIPLDSSEENNLCVKAYRLLKQDFPQMGNVRMRLKKNIPFGAGLGGGSADAAETLKMLNSLFSLKLSVSRLQDYAARLGSDCPVFIRNQAVFATGRGGIFHEIPPLDFGAYDMLLLKPEDAVSTAEAYKSIRPRAAGCDLREAVRLPMESWKDKIINQFEESVFPQHPNIRECKERLYREGAVYASMTGSGACVFGFFPCGKTPQIRDVASWLIHLE